MEGGRGERENERGGGGREGEKDTGMMSEIIA